ncbi:MAG: hypothetical protein ACRDWX_00895 [Acidimicrobiia bacterium]
MDTLLRPPRVSEAPATARAAPWWRPRVVMLVGLGLVSAAVLIVMNPLLLVAANTPSGGDMGAHVYAPAYLRDVLLPSGRLMGWSMGWFAGFPIFYFYFPLPALTTVALDLLLPYGVAFKIVTVLGLLALPFATYVFARGMGFDRWASTVAGAAGGSFVFMESYTIYGGNIPSTLAGEFSFSWSFALMMVYLGLLARATREGRSFGLAAGVALALTALAHVITTLAAVLASLPLLFVRRGRLRVIESWAIGFALAGFWALPLVARIGLTADMHWVPLAGWEEIFPTEIWPVAMLGIPAIGWTIWRAGRDRTETLPLLWLSLVPVAAYFLLPVAAEALPRVGKLWNGRLLPFWFYGLHVFAGLGVGLAIGAVARALPPRRWILGAATLGAAIVFLGTALAGMSFIPGWAAWNYSGYEGKEGWPEYQALMQEMDRLPPGRVQWEASNELNQFGTPMSPMLFPYWTEGTHPSMEGLFFESALTTPFHFLNHAEMSLKPSNPIPGLRYHTFDFDRGLRHLDLFGVRYYVSFTEEAAEAARSRPQFTEVAAPDPFVIFELPPSPLVEPARFVPAVHLGSGFHQAALDWYDDVGGLDHWLVADGPADWPRGAEAQPAIDPRPAVSDIVVEDHRIAFTTSGVGVPHLVKVSYFPNWQAVGAEGPYRAAPSLMVVVPTQERVELKFGATWAEQWGMILTVLGLALVSVTVVRRRRPGAGA